MLQGVDPRVVIGQGRWLTAPRKWPHMGLGPGLGLRLGVGHGPGCGVETYLRLGWGPMWVLAGIWGLGFDLGCGSSWRQGSCRGWLQLHTTGSSDPVKASLPRTVLPVVNAMHMANDRVPKRTDSPTEVRKFQSQHAPLTMFR